MVVELVRYPVKSMAGESLPSLDLNWQGIDGDRGFAFYKVGDRTRFPWFTARDLPALVRYRARLREPRTSLVAGVDVLTPAGSWIPIGDPALLADLSTLSADELGLLQLGQGTHDSMPVSIVSTATHAAIEDTHGESLDRRRFRSNIVIESAEREGAWRNARLTFGELPEAAALVVATPIERCSMITVDPDTAERETRVMRTIVRDFANQIGIYASTAKPGRIHLGDDVTLVGAGG